MGGGGSKAPPIGDQVYEHITKQLTNVIATEMQSVQSRVSQDASSIQSIRDVKIDKTGSEKCITHHQDVTISQDSVNTGVLGSSLRFIDKSNMAEKIVAAVEALSKANPVQRADGFLDWNTSPEGDKKIFIDDTVQNNISAHINQRFEKYVGQHYENQQVIERIVIIAPCGNVRIDQRSLTEMWAKDISNGAADIVMNEPSTKAFIASIPPRVAADNSKKDGGGTVSVILGTIRALFNDVMDKLGPQGTLVLFGGLFVVLILMPMLRRRSS
jgi:hypothetical protein